MISHYYPNGTSRFMLRYIVLLSFNFVDFCNKIGAQTNVFMYSSCAKNGLNSETKNQRDFELLLLSVIGKVNKFSQFTNNDMSFLSLSWKDYFPITIGTIRTWEVFVSLLLNLLFCSFLFVEWKVYGKDPMQ